MRTRLLFALSLVALATFGGASRTTSGVAATAQPASPVFPADTWQRVSDPTRAGWSKPGLDSVQALISGMKSSAMVVVEHGKIVYSYGDITAQSYLASVRKSILSMLYGIEISRGHIDTSKTLATLGINDVGGLLPSERQARIQDLLGARSGVYHAASYPGDFLAEAPPRGSQKHGTYQLYSNWDFNVLGAIFELETKRNIYDALQEELARPLHMQDFRRDLQKKEGDTTRSIHPAYPIFLTTRDMARIGLLMLNKGGWNGKQIVPRDWVAKSTGVITPIAQLNPSRLRRGRAGYGYLWWVWDGPWNTGPYEGAYSGFGAVGQFITVIPKLDLVVAHKTIPGGGRNVSEEQYFQLLDRIIAARTGAIPKPRPPVMAPYDVLITNARIVDGTGGPAYSGDVAITGRQIARVSTTPIPRDSALRVIDARGHVLAPGFIDMHAHLEPLLTMPDAQSAARQGVTLALGGPDGGGPWPFGTYLDSADRAGLGTNVAYLTGHNTIRSEVMGSANRAPTPDELARMARMVGQAMHEGAFGISTGLRYIPGFYSKTDEVVALSRVAADSGGIYTSHLREEGLGLFEGVAEALEIGRQAHIPIVLTHHKAIGQQMWGKSTVTLHMVDSARAAGTDVMMDQYPYTASSTGLNVLVPPWALEGGRTGLQKRLEDPVLKDSITRGVIDYLINDRGGGDVRRVQFANVAWDHTLDGKTLYDWAVRRGIQPTPERTAPLVLEGVVNGGASMVFHIIDEGDVRRIMAHPMTMIGSDGRLSRPGDGVPHPRNYGTFPRVLGEYVRVQHVLTLEQAVNKMTGMSAKRLGLTDRGCIRAGCFADITVFDPATIADKGTFTEPHQYPVGIDWVLVNGTPVVAEGRFTDARPGRVLKHVPARR
ncbi:MAG: amidohydrolase family protein [Gemmatimonadales bacterium]